MSDDTKPTTLDEARASFRQSGAPVRSTPVELPTPPPAMKLPAPKLEPMCHCGEPISAHDGICGCNTPVEMPTPEMLGQNENGHWEVACSSGLRVEVRPLRVKDEMLLRDQRFPSPYHAVAEVFRRRVTVIDPGPVYIEAFRAAGEMDWMTLLKSDFEVIAQVLKGIS